MCLGPWIRVGLGLKVNSEWVLLVANKIKQQGGYSDQATGWLFISSNRVAIHIKQQGGNSEQIKQQSGYSDQIKQQGDYSDQATG
jgi:hypothetical protein